MMVYLNPFRSPFYMYSFIKVSGMTLDQFQFLCVFFFDFQFIKLHFFFVRVSFVAGLSIWMIKMCSQTSQNHSQLILIYLVFFFLFSFLFTFQVCINIVYCIQLLINRIVPTILFVSFILSSIHLFKGSFFFCFVYFTPLLKVLFSFLIVIICFFQSEDAGGKTLNALGQQGGKTYLSVVV